MMKVRKAMPLVSLAQAEEFLASGMHMLRLLLDCTYIVTCMAAGDGRQAWEKHADLTLSMLLLPCTS